MSFKIIITKAIFKLLSLAIGFALLPLTFFLHFLGYRHATVFTDRIGHLALEPDCLLKEQMLKLIPRHKWIILAKHNCVANDHLLTYWQPHFYIFSNKAICFLVESMSRWGLMRYNISHYARAQYQSQAAFRIYAKWADRPPLLSLTTTDKEWGKTMLKELGLPENAWFVCVHARESGFSPIDEEIHGHRNCQIEHTIPSMHEIINRGGWIIRIGDPSMQRLPELDGVIDYAHHPLKSARLDIILCAMARFILGNTSGIALVGTVFGIPCALANMTPLTALGFSPMDIIIPKLYWSQFDGRYLRFKEILSSRSSQSQYNAELIRMGVRLDENTPEEIKDLTIEMINRLEIEQQVFKSTSNLSDTFVSMLESHHYSFGAISRISESFLKRHYSLLK